MPLDDLTPLGRYKYYAGTAGTVTLATGEALLRVWAHATAASTLVITPQGANQSGVAGPSIPIPAGTMFGPFTFNGNMTGGTVLVFTSTDSFFVEVHTLVSGAAHPNTSGF